MKQLVIWIVATLLAIFPNSMMLLGTYQSLSFDGDASMSKVVSAINTHDIASLEAMMCQNIKDTVPDLRNEIVRLIDAVGGEIKEYHKTFGGWSKSINDGIGRLYLRSDGITFQLSGKAYNLAITWGIVDNVNPEETGIRRLTLLDPDLVDPPNHDYSVVDIRATVNY
jgi:hypothetical protein